MVAYRRQPLTRRVEKWLLWESWLYIEIGLLCLVWWYHFKYACSWHTLTRGFLEQYLTEKLAFTDSKLKALERETPPATQANKVVAYRGRSLTRRVEKWLLWESWLYIEIGLLCLVWWYHFKYACSWHTLTRGFLEQYLTEKLAFTDSKLKALERETPPATQANKVVAYRGRSLTRRVEKWLLWESWLYIEIGLLCLVWWYHFKYACSWHTLESR